jgi:peptidoglycan/LPS O-acetylase OafA/YrhL
MKDRLAYVDGLRAIAVIGVVFSHAAKYTMSFVGGGVPFHAMYEGAHGVDLFFVISGFCLSYPTLARLHAGLARPFDLAGFFARRIVRIVPPYWIAFAVVLAGAIALVAAGYSLPWPTVVMPPTLSNGLMQLAFLTPGNNLVGSFWTLAVEFRWYLAFPLVLWLWIRYPFAFATVGLGALALYAMHAARIVDLATLPAFMLGIVAADMTIRRHRLCAWAAALIIPALAVAYWLEPKGHLNFAYQDQIWWQVPFFFLILGAGANRQLRAVFECKPLLFIGIASYSIYLLHDPLMALYGEYGGTSPIACAAIGVLSGLLFWRYCERPFIATPLKSTLVSHVTSALRATQQALRLPGRIVAVAPIPATKPIEP